MQTNLARPVPVGKTPVVLDCVVGLGSNLGDRLRVLRLAVERLSSAGPVACSRVYETPAVGPPQPDFLNAAVRLAWSRPPAALLATLLAIERSFGRIRDVRWGPRTLDLDLLWIDGLRVEEPGLVVPHPQLRRRAFALAPLIDVAPEARDPESGVPLASWLRCLDTGALAVVAPAWRVE